MSASVIEILFNEKSELSQQIRKACACCGIEKPFNKDYYHVNRGSKGDLRSVCKVCRSSVGKKYNKAARKLMSIFKIKTPPVGTPCSCCGRTDLKLVCDHIHNTQTIRGFICDNCNVGIGRLGDTVEGVEKALKYLQGSYLT
jgi:protein-arginine kinase activator protein McsA